MNAGKQFEKDFKASVLPNQLYLRLKDAGGWSTSTDLRFTSSNLCDCLVFSRRTLYLLELKSHKGKSVPASCLKQADKLADINQVGTIPAFIINFRDQNETWLIGAETVREELQTRASLSIETCREYGLCIPQRKMRVHWIYDLSVL
jgi:recombination protein U